jgi:hypothetical protein
MFAQRHIFFRLRAFISGCLAALDAAPPFPARVMPMEIGISFSCPKKKHHTDWKCLTAFFTI